MLNSEFSSEGGRRTGARRRRAGILPGVRKKRVPPGYLPGTAQWCVGSLLPQPRRSPRKDEEILVRKEIDCLHLVQPGCIHPAGHLRFRNDKIRLLLMRTLISFKVDHHETAILFE